MNTQYCKDLLHSFEQFNLTQTVRGFQQSHVDDQGVCLRNEIILNNLWQGSKILTPLNFFFALDFGYLQPSTYSFFNLGRPGLTKLLSWVAGIHYHNDWLVLDFYYTQPLQKVRYPEKNTSPIQVSLSFKLHSLIRYRSTAETQAHKLAPLT